MPNYQFQLFGIPGDVKQGDDLPPPLFFDNEIHSLLYLCLWKLCNCKAWRRMIMINLINSRLNVSLPQQQKVQTYSTLFIIMHMLKYSIMLN